MGNADIWRWYRDAAIPKLNFLNKVHRFLKAYLMVHIRSVLKLPALKNGSTSAERFLRVHGSAAHGLFVTDVSDLDIGVNLRLIEQSGKGVSRFKQQRFLEMLGEHIRKEPVKQNEKLLGMKPSGKSGHSGKSK